MRNRWLERVDGPLVLAGFCLLLATAAAHSQAPAPGPKAPPPLLPLTAGTPIVPAIATKPETKLAYVLGPDDQISVTVLDVPEISDKVYRIDLNGFIKLPLVTGRIQAAGLTVEQLEDEIAGILKTILKDPQVTISLVAFRSEPVSVLGSVKTPGVVQLQGRSTLVDVLSAVGGLADDAGYTVKIVRHREFGRIPLPSAVDDASGEYSMAEVGASEILEASNPAQNILICPHDEITVPRGEMIYVVGTVPRAGGFILQQRATLSVLQALSLAGGTDKGAATKNTKILRPGPRGDILFVPSSASKKTLLRVGDVAASVAGLMIYRLP
jgi:polysaccharide export outer membrane protein